MAETQKRKDRRVERTKRTIKRAFLKLLLTKDYNRITVKDIATEADVDRKTIYNYYRGVYEIREEIENNAIKAIEDAFSGFDSKNMFVQTRQIFEALHGAVSKHSELFDYLFKSESNSKIIFRIVQDIQTAVSKMLSQTTLSHLPMEKIDFISSFYAAGTMNIYYQWFNSDRHIPLEVISAGLGKAVLNGIAPLSENTLK
ncbi:MAG: TetR/AcrR family transcriptional regulator C-terminal domain-containing protein [Clostridia bacterium]|nr:TetR/AcrR family transcriptional regulator C-terminal domain-containing protein [Clostridia bacterium]